MQGSWGDEKVTLVARCPLGVAANEGAALDDRIEASTCVTGGLVDPEVGTELSAADGSPTAVAWELRDCNGAHCQS